MELPTVSHDVICFCEWFLGVGGTVTSIKYRSADTSFLVEDAQRLSHLYYADVRYSLGAVLELDGDIHQTYVAIKRREK